MCVCVCQYTIAIQDVLAISKEKMGGREGIVPEINFSFSHDIDDNVSWWRATTNSYSFEMNKIIMSHPSILEYRYQSEKSCTVQLPAGVRDCIVFSLIFFFRIVVDFVSVNTLSKLMDDKFGAIKSSPKSYSDRRSMPTKKKKKNWNNKKNEMKNCHNHNTKREYWSTTCFE